MPISIIYWIIFGVVVAVILGAIRLPRWLVGLLSLLALPAGLLYFVAYGSSGSSSDSKAALLIWGGLLALFLAPVAGVVGFFAAWLGKKISDKPVR